MNLLCVVILHILCMIPEHIAELFRIVHSDFEVLSVLLFNPALSYVSNTGFICFQTVSFLLKCAIIQQSMLLNEIRVMVASPVSPLRSVGGGAYVGCYGLGSPSGLLPCCELLGEPNSFGAT